MREREKDETRRRYTIGQTTRLKPIGCFFLFARKKEQNLRGEGTRRGNYRAGKVNEPLHIPSVPFDYNFGNVWLFDSRLLLKF